MQEQFERTELLFGSDAMETLKKSRVAVFGIGGVGGHTAEALVRSGIGAIDLIDNDEVCISNINRQIFATVNTVGQLKTASAMKRLLDINPECKITVHNIFFMPETSDMIDFSQYDYVVDAIDTVTGKIEIIMRSEKAAVPVISSMGAGNKLDPTAFEVSDIYKTSVCPLARTMRHEMKKRGVNKLKVVYSKEQPFIPPERLSDSGKRIPASNAFVPSVAGLIIAGEVIKDLTGLNR
ncbi:MAG: tRNA threonylcarbamoyladenosine dehydratase [Ruminococcus sp.]|nr:tRNA threonylcarbamoyladenosine dehydratase [Ruminococcus sp.]MDE7137900.1 tRNA threonylcarbamoyladenosine dehydratase [Ruminococcus sp.]